jgi:hypothetical protein
VATPPDSHFEIACAAISEGKHILVEKPLAARLSDCKAMVEMAIRNKVFLLVGHEKRFHPTFEKVRSILREGLIGKPIMAGFTGQALLSLIQSAWSRRVFILATNGAGGTGPSGAVLFRIICLTMSTWSEIGSTILPLPCMRKPMNVAHTFLGWSADDSVWKIGPRGGSILNGFVMRFETGTVGRSLSPIWSLGSGIGEWTEYGYIFGTHGQLVLTSFLGTPLKTVESRFGG